MSRLLAVLFVVLAPAAAGARGRGGRSGATVVYVTSDRAYVDRGAADGLRAGDVLSAGRATCKVVEIGDHFASCEGGAVRTGDSVQLPRPPTARPEPAQRRPAA